MGSPKIPSKDGEVYLKMEAGDPPPPPPKEILCLLQNFALVQLRNNNKWKCRMQAADKQAPLGRVHLTFTLPP